MIAKRWVWVLFGIMVLAQLFVPLQMIFTAEDVVSEGTLFKLKTRPYDPKDPFRGNYIRLNFDIGTHSVMDTTEFNKGEKVYVFLRKDRDGYGQVAMLTKFQDEVNSDNYLEGTIRSVWISDGVAQITIQYPFERFYMEESKAPEAERVYREAARDSTRNTYALVSVRNGTGILQDVLIDGISISVLAEEALTESDTSRTK